MSYVIYYYYFITIESVKERYDLIYGLNLHKRYNWKNEKPLHAMKCQMWEA